MLSSDAPQYLYWNYLKALLWVRSGLKRRDYQVLDEGELRRCRRSDKVFIFGSGYSLNEISPSEWAHFTSHDVFGFSGFVFQQWARVDFHLVREWNDDWPRWWVVAQHYAKQLRENHRFDNAVLLLQRDYTAVVTNALLGYGLLNPGRRVHCYRTAKRVDDLPSSSLAKGVTHGIGTLTDCVNLACLMGWKEIVLVGVDLYDSRYFWAPPDATVTWNDAGQMVPAPVNSLGRRWDEAHNTVRNGIVRLMGIWWRLLGREGIALSVYNSRSLLAGELPVYRQR